MSRVRAYVVMGILYAVIIVLPFFIYVDHPVFFFLEQPLIILLPTLLISRCYRKKTGMDWKTFYRIKKIPLLTVLCLTAIAFLLPAISNVIVQLTPVFNEGTYGNEDFLFLPGDQSGPMWQVGVFFYSLFFGCIFPGICEETLFRGSMLRMSQDGGLPKAAVVLVSGLLFAVFHMNLDQLFYTFAIGIVLAAVVLVTNSLISGIYVHIVYNFIIDLSTSFDLERYRGLVRVADFIENMNQIWQAVLAVLLIGGIIYYINRIEKRRILHEGGGKDLQGVG